MLTSLKMFPLLKGVRSEASADLTALADCLERLSFLAQEISDIMEPDLNPVFCSLLPLELWRALFKKGINRLE